MAMKEIIEVAFRELLAAVQTAKLYNPGHPIFNKAVEKAYKGIMDVLNEKPELTVGIVGDELAFEKEIFFELSKLSKTGIGYLKSRGIEKVTFKRGLSLKEVEVFIFFLVAQKDEIKGKAQDYLVLNGVRNIIVGKVSADGSTESKGEAGTGQDKTGQDDYFANISAPLSRILNQEAFDGLALKVTVNNVIDNLGGQFNQLLKLSTLKRYDLGTFTHLINVSILSMYFSSKLGFAREVVLDIGLSALLHDIGKLYISRKIIRKAGQLDSAEFSRMESHTVLGASLILKYTGSVGIMPVVVSFEHHLKFDSGGYPKLRFPGKPHIVSQIVSICDAYDALSERRSYKSDYPPDTIYNLMMRGSGTTYNPQLLSRFFQVMGVWPVGSIVSLSDNRVAVVVAENQDDIFAPLVKVIYPEKEDKAIDLKAVSGGLKVARYLNPWTEGKDFLHLI
jgi:putative nucleotidyltransferase with HDIG domain